MAHIQEGQRLTGRMSCMVEAHLGRIQEVHDLTGGISRRVGTHLALIQKGLTLTAGRSSQPRRLYTVLKELTFECNLETIKGIFAIKYPPCLLH